MNAEEKENKISTLKKQLKEKRDEVSSKLDIIYNEIDKIQEEIDKLIDPDLVEEYKKIRYEQNKLINECLSESNRYLQKAITISEATGMHFFSEISEIRQTYVPLSFSKIWADKMSKQEKTVLGIPNHTGWMRSNFC